MINDHIHMNYIIILIFLKFLVKTAFYGKVSHFHNTALLANSNAFIQNGFVVESQPTTLHWLLSW